MRLLKVSLIGAVCLALAGSAFSYENYHVRRGDTLWGIAMKHRPSKRTNVYEMIQAIRHLNPTAFGGSDGKTLKAGADLKLPITVSEIHDAAFAKKAQTEQAPAAKPEAEQITTAAKSTTASIAQKTTKAIPPAVTKSLETTTSMTTHAQAARAHSPKAAQNHVEYQYVSTQLSGAQPVTTTQAKTAAIYHPEAAAETATTQTTQATTATPSHSSSIWSWLWFAIILGLVSYIWYNRRRLFASFSAGNDIAARRLGLSRAEPAVEAYKTETLWKSEKRPSYGKKAGAGEGEAMSTAMIEMAEGQYHKAKDTLLEAVSLDTHNLELRMKLLDVYVALDDSEAYKKESDYILEHMLNEADPRWNRIRSTYLRNWAYDQN